MAEAASIVRTERIAGRGIIGTLASLLSLTSDAVLVFGASRRILIANESAEALFGIAHGELGGMDIRDLVATTDGIRPEDDEDWLPFAVDGSSIASAVRPGTGIVIPIACRCARISGTDGACMAVLRALEPDAAFALERDRMVGELTLANRRLAGTLRIVLETLGANDLDSLLDHVVRELREVCGANAALAYVAESNELHLMAITGRVSTLGLRTRIPFNSGIARIAQISGTAQRLHVSADAPTHNAEGAPAFIHLVNMGTREDYRIPASQVPPFSDMLLVPVWFGRSMICAILVGWTDPHETTTEDARLLDAVCQYLSAQIAGALSSLRAKRSEELDRMAQGFHDRLAASEDPERMWREELADCIEEVLDAHVAAIRVDNVSHECFAELPDAGEVRLPLSPGMFADGVDLPDESLVTPIREGDALNSFLSGVSELRLGALVISDRVEGERGAMLVLCDPRRGPLGDLELDFLRRICSETTLLARGIIARGEDRRISQALQLGMRNELQKVDGIEAEGIYSSATAAAFVGGDFYDLIRLPERRACVIMGDVSGKGVEAASVSAAVRTALGAYAWVGLSPAGMVRSLNDFLLGFSRIETFATLFVGIVDLDAAELVYCSAGHPPAILVAGGNELSTLDVQSGLVGAFSGMGFRDGRIRIAKGDTLLLYTDGVTEARSPEGAFFGEDGLREAVLRECASGTVSLAQSLLGVLDAYTGNKLDDDVAMVTLRFEGVGSA